MDSRSEDKTTGCPSHLLSLHFLITIATDVLLQFLLYSLVTNPGLKSPLFETLRLRLRSSLAE